MQTTRRIHPLVWILLAGIAVRALLVVWFHDEPLNIYDERDYNTLAVNLVERGMFSLDGERPIALRPPLYPAVVAGVYTVFGVENYQAVRVLQAILSLVNVALVYLLAKDVYDRRVAAWAAGFFCFYPSLLGQTCLLLTETLFTLLLTLVCLVVVRFLRHGWLPLILAAGVLIGLAALTRSILWLFPPVLAVCVLVFWNAPLRRRLAAVGLLVAGFAATIAPWAVRNTRLNRTLVVIDTMGGQNFMMGNYEHTPLTRAWDAIIYVQAEDPRAWNIVLEERCPGSKDLTPGQRDKLALRYGLRYAADHPGQTLLRDAIKTFQFWQLERSLVAGMGRGWFGDPPLPAILLLTLVIFGTYTAAMVAGLFGAAVTPPDDWRVFGFLLLVTVYVWALHALVFAHSRYHLPLMAIVLVFAAAGWANRRTIWQRRGTARFWIAAVLSAMLVAGWIWEIAVVDFQRFAGVIRRLV